ncbi:RHS repeat-associated core domain-containing protein [Shewanella woodyi]|uniref:YD repeat protein n=1 Tax=Shewanella woodyi (strain ATCC 51908 / MS32) TaxID=392500 RepID=B1KH35_SHEWM|nr:RHS repeat-associated core domain-containing protein [Shewanella woodyi]ACA88347.1 hypothetical protein Swoo_4091 [Shewanella woodyi ATCC 51908]
MKNSNKKDALNCISRRNFLSGSISIALLTGISLTSIKSMAKAVNLDSSLLLTIIKHELSGFNGELLDPITGNYQLGQGYRFYNPILMRFQSPDSMSPFGEAGLNVYAYCHGDPVNFNDPTGHLDGWKIGFGIFAVVTGIIGAVLAPFTGGTSFAVAMGVVSGVLGAIGGSLTIASAAVEDSNPTAAANLDIASIVFSVASIAAGVSGALKGTVSGFKSRFSTSNFKTTSKLKIGKSAKARNDKFFTKIKDNAFKEVDARSGALSVESADTVMATKLESHVVGQRDLSSKFISMKPKVQYKPTRFLNNTMAWKVENVAKTGMNSGHFARSFAGALVRQGLSMSSGSFLAASKLVTARDKLDNINENNNTDTPQAPGTFGQIQATFSLDTDIVNRQIRNGIFA